MAFRKPLLLVLSMATLLLLSIAISAGLAGAKTDSNNSTATNSKSKKKWAVLDGFRSAKFGMNENKVKKAITKDFKIPNRKIKKTTNPTEQTISLSISVPKLFGHGGPATIGYVFGHQSKKLIQVNVIWGLGTSNKNVGGQTVVDAANLLRTYFAKKKYKDDGSLVINAKMDETKIMVFRGTDQKGRMAVLVLDNPKPLKDESAKDASKRISLQLSYILNPHKPDILTIEEGMF